MFPDLPLDVFDDLPVRVVYDLLYRSVPLHYQYLLCAGLIHRSEVHLLDLMALVAEDAKVLWLESRGVPMDVRQGRVGGHVVDPSPPRQEGLAEVEERQDAA